MPSHPSKPPVWISHRAQFGNLLHALASQRQLAVDTESNSLYTYTERVCLLQVSTPKADYLIDTLADLPIRELHGVFADPAIEKIFHAAEYDLICLRRDFDLQVHNLFDTMHAARVLGEEKLGLADMLAQYFGVEQGKSYQKADWGKRPLSVEMQSYARMDTHYLIRLRAILEEKLSGKGLLELAKEDFNRLSIVKSNHRNTQLYYHIGGYHKLDGRQLRLLEELCRFRDQVARKLDCPQFKVISNSALMMLAIQKPTTRAQLDKMEGISAHLLERYASGILDAIRLGLSSPPLELEHRRRLPQAYIDRLDALKQWRKQAAAKMQVQSDIILPRDVMESIAKTTPLVSTDLKKEMVALPWRFEHFGEQILGVLNKERKI